MNEDYIRTARAKGLTERAGRRQARSARRAHADPHDLRSRRRAAARRCDPDREDFSLNGLGKYAVERHLANDLPKILGVTLLAAFFVVFANLIVDILYAVVDPRVRTR